MTCPAPAPPLDFAALQFVYVELTVKCNLRCHFCDNAMRNLYRDLPAERFRAIVDQLRPGTRLGLHGLGEPTLHKDLVALVAYAKAHGLYVYFNTNHTVTSETQMRAFVEHELDELRVSMSAGTREGFADYAGRDLFEDLVANTRRMLAIRGDRPKPLVRLIFVLTQQSWPEFARVAALADDLGVDELQVQTVLDWGKADEPADGCRPDASTFERARAAVLRAAAGVRRVRVVLPFPADGSAPEPGAPGRCQWPFNATWITADGHVTPCCNLHDPRQVSFGNVFDASLDRIWLGEAYRDFRTRYAADRVDWCKSCPVHYGRFKSYTYERPAA